MKDSCSTCTRKIDCRASTLLSSPDFCGFCARPLSRRACALAAKVGARLARIVEDFPLAL